MKPLLLSLLLLAACASGPQVTPEKQQQLSALETQLNADWAAGKYPSHEVLEATYAVEYNKIYPLNALGYEYMNYRVDVGRRIDRGEITFQAGDALIRAKREEVRSRSAQQTTAEQHAQIAAFMRAVGAISNAGLAYMAAHPAAQPQFPVICRQTNIGVICQ